MQKWEYRVVVEEIDWDGDSGKPNGIDKNRLTQLGNEGWELVDAATVTGPLDHGSSCTVEIHYLFKRPKAAEERKPTPTTSEVASRAQSARDRNPEGKTAKSGFAERAQRAAAKKAPSNGNR